MSLFIHTNSSSLTWKASLIFFLFIEVQNYHRIVRDVMANMKSRYLEVANDICLEGAHIAQGGREFLQI